MGTSNYFMKNSICLQLHIPNSNKKELEDFIFNTLKFKVLKPEQPTQIDYEHTICHIFNFETKEIRNFYGGWEQIPKPYSFNRITELTELLTILDKEPFEIIDLQASLPTSYEGVIGQLQKRLSCEDVIVIKSNSENKSWLEFFLIH